MPGKKVTIDPELEAALNNTEDLEETGNQFGGDTVDLAEFPLEEVYNIPDEAYLTPTNSVPRVGEKKPEPVKEKERPLPAPKKPVKKIGGRDLHQLRKEADSQFEKDEKRNKAPEESEEALDLKKAQLTRVLNGYMRTYQGKIDFEFKKGGYNTSMTLKYLEETHYLVSNIVNSSNLPQVIEESIVQAANISEQVVGWINSPYINLTYPVSFTEKVEKLVRGGAFKPEVEQLAIEYSFMGQDPMTRLWLKMGLLAFETINKNAPSTVSRMDANINAGNAASKVARNSNPNNKDL